MGRILIIEDDAALRELMAISLMRQHEILEAANGKLGLLAVHQHHPDLVLCDIAMPEMDGYQVLQNLRDTPETASIPFVFITAYIDRADVRRGMDLGADDYLAKPFTAQELRDMVNGCLRKKALQEAALKRAIEDIHQNIVMSLPHELRTAIMVIEGYVHLMLEEVEHVSPHHQEMLLAVGNASRRLHRLAEKFLWYSKIQLMDTLNVKTQVTEKALEAVQWIATEKAHQAERFSDLHLDLDDVMICMPPECVQKVVEEVVENAFKFSAAGTAVNIRAKVHDDMYVISVTNFGRGMSETQIARIEAFTQFERDTYEQQGLGLGLVIAKRLTELFGGKFTIHSIPQEKTEIIAALPMQHTDSMFVPAQAAAQGERLVAGTIPM
ncbi:MAG: hybrid sensor histidine kinase/response regulator [Anaerolineae bacterium]